jgi:cytochrome b6-f complex iron-sulfur subunit
MNKNKKNGAVTEAKKPAMTRRTFFWWMWAGLGCLAVAEYIVVTLDFLRPGKRRREDGGGGIVVAGPVERFEPGTVTAFPQGKFYLSRLNDGGFLALSRECTHLGCTVPWDSERMQFVCPCHASMFDITGEVLSPPAPRALDFYPVRIENGIVKVDTRRAKTRKAFEIAQVTHAE